MADIVAPVVAGSQRFVTLLKSMGFGADELVATFRRKVRMDQTTTGTPSANRRAGAPEPMVVRTFLFEVVVIIAIVELILMLVLWMIPTEMPVILEAVVDATVLAGISGPILWWISIRPLSKRMASEFTRAELTTAELEAELATRNADARLLRALEMASDEPEVMDVVGIALRDLVPAGNGELLMADSSAAHLNRITSVGAEPPSCPASSPHDCVVIRTGQPRSFESSEDVDACPHMRGRACGPISAACVPLAIVGRSVGVLHVAGVEHEPPVASVSHLTRLASATGTRLGLMPALADSELQAGTDSLTGLANRRTLEHRLHRLGVDLRPGESFGVLMADLDHFKQLNDVYGHEVGDRALRLFSRVLQDVVRSHDVAARYGGEEFVCLIEGADETQAAQAGERIRASLKELLADSTTPEFTVSIGVAIASYGMDPTEVLRLSDRALYEAKRHGRDRVDVASAGAEVAPQFSSHSSDQMPTASPRASASSSR